MAGEKKILWPLREAKRFLSTRELVRIKHQPLDAFTGNERLDDFRHIRHCDVPVKEMVRLDEDADTARALIEAARFTDARAELRQTARRDLFLQRRADFFGPAHRARTFRVVIRSPIRADKEIALAQRHVVNSAIAAGRSTRFDENYFE